MGADPAGAPPLVGDAAADADPQLGTTVGRKLYI
jgi:hypothetical protein